jgi:hypothetical protein
MLGSVFDVKVEKIILKNIYPHPLFYKKHKGGVSYKSIIE